MKLLNMYVSSPQAIFFSHPFLSTFLNPDQYHTPRPNLPEGSLVSKLHQVVPLPQGELPANLMNVSHRTTFFPDHDSIPHPPLGLGDWKMDRNKLCAQQTSPTTIPKLDQATNNPEFITDVARVLRNPLQEWMEIPALPPSFPGEWTVLNLPRMA